MGNSVPEHLWSWIATYFTRYLCFDVCETLLPFDIWKREEEKNIEFVWSRQAQTFQIGFGYWFQLSLSPPPSLSLALILFTIRRKTSSKKRPHRAILCLIYFHILRSFTTVPTKMGMNTKTTGQRWRNKWVYQYRWGTNLIRLIGWSYKG